MKTIRCEQLPEPAGHYSHAVVHGGVVYVSGMLPVRDGSAVLANATVEEQTEQAIANLTQVLDTAGSGLDRVIKTTLYLADIELWDRVNVVYARAFSGHRPARSVVPTGGLHHGFLVEIEAIAAVSE